MAFAIVSGLMLGLGAFSAGFSDSTTIHGTYNALVILWEILNAPAGIYLLHATEPSWVVWGVIQVLTSFLWAKAFTLVALFLKTRWTTRNIVIAIFTFTILVMGGYTSLILYLTWPIQSYTVAQSGVFGDSFGVITALFTSLAFGGLIITVLLQRDELSLQRKELAETRFSNAFFKLLDYYKHNLNSISAKTPENGKINGIDVLIQQTAKFQEAQSENNAWYIPESEYLKVYEYQLCLDVERHLLRQTRYMSTLENILALVCEQIEDDRERRRYWKIVESQLTVHEVKYLFYRTLVEPRDSTFCSMVIKSQILLDRLSVAGIPHQHTESFERIHGISIHRKSSRNRNLPYTTAEIKALRRELPPPKQKKKKKDRAVVTEQESTTNS